MKIGLALLALNLALTGCVNFGERSENLSVVYYVLDDTTLKEADPPPHAKGRVESSEPPSAKAVRVDAPTLLVLDTTTGSFYDTDQLIFSRSPATRGQYQFARWTERPGKRFADLMRTRLDRLGSYHVTSAGGYVRGNLLLDTELIEFYHDATSEPGQVRLVLRAELVDLRQRKLLGRRVFEQQVALTRYDAAGAAEASSLAVSRTLDELTPWLATLQ